MSKRVLPEANNKSQKRRKIGNPSISDLIGGSTAETQRTLPSAACISNVLSKESQENLNEKLLKVLAVNKNNKQVWKQIF